MKPAATVVNNIRAAHGFDKADGEYFTELLNGAIGNRSSCAKIAR
jgi:N utilization substance protein B